MWVPIVLGVLVTLGGLAAYRAWHPNVVARTAGGRTAIFAGAFAGPLLVLAPLTALLYEAGGAATVLAVVLSLVLVLLVACVLLLLTSPPRLLLPQWFRASYPRKGWGR